MSPVTVDPRNASTYLLISNIWWEIHIQLQNLLKNLSVPSAIFPSFWALEQNQVTAGFQLNASFVGELPL